MKKVIKVMFLFITSLFLALTITPVAKANSEAPINELVTEKSAPAQRALGGFTTVRGLNCYTDTNTVAVGNSITIHAVITPKNAVALIVFRSSNKNVATVDIYGNVKGVSVGDVVITASCGGFTVNTYITVVPGETGTPVQGIFLERSCTVYMGYTKTLVPSITPTTATNKTVRWSSTNRSVATVSNGVVTPVSPGTTTITATTESGGYTASTTVTVKDSDEWTLMIYMCGSDLESNSSYATLSLKEICSVGNKPNGVNVIVQTGGASSWNSYYGINNKKISRYHVSNGTLVLDETLNDTSMGFGSTFEDFLDWGINNYPAKKIGVILWSHGGAMRGVGPDQNHSNDTLLNSEVNYALNKVFYHNGLEGNKLEFIGYDACLMGLQDIAEFNSQYFKYMIASEEYESAIGWRYDTWIDDLYANKNTTEILKAIVDGYVEDNDSSYYSNYTTLAYYNLSKMDTYRLAFENLASELSKRINSKNKESFNTIVECSKAFGNDDYQYFGSFDVIHFLQILSNSSFNPGLSYIIAATDAYHQVVEYSVCGSGTSNANGMAMYWSVSSSCEKNIYYTSSQTNFNNWRNLVELYGN